MDEEMKAAFARIDQKFDQVDQRFDQQKADVKTAFELTWSMMERSSEEIKTELRGEFRGEMGQLRGEMGQLRGEMGQFRGAMGQLRGEMGQFREEMRAKFTDVHNEIHDLRGDIRIVTEGVIAVHQKVDRRTAELETKIEGTWDLRERIADLEKRLFRP